MQSLETVAKVLHMDITEISLTAVLSALLTFLGSATGLHLLNRFVLKTKRKVEQKEKDVLLTSLNSISEMDDCMEEIINNTPVERFLIMSGKDSGKIPNPRSPYFVQVLWQKYKDEADHLIKRADGIRVDSNYIGIIISILTEGYCKNVVRDMKNSLIKRMLAKESVAYVEHYFIKQEKSNVVYYLSIATSKEGETFDNPDHREIINFNIEKIRQIFESLNG